MSVRIAARIVAVLGVVICAGAFAQVYKWTDSAGKVHYGDKPPDDVKKQELKIGITSFDAPPMIDAAAIIRRPSKVDIGPKRESATLVMYSTSWCGVCKRARAYMAEKGIAYREVDVEASAANGEEFSQYGGRGVPLFVANGRKMRGFSADAMERFLKS